MNRISLLSSALLLLSCGAAGTAAELVLAAGGRSEYQIVVPDEYPSPAIGACLGQTARLVQTAFQANGFEVPVVPEAQHDSARPAIYLGNTAFARSNGIEVERLAGWGNIQRAAGKNL
ncbi:MAG: hypothetical protein PHO07_19850, partial [Pirellulales bacterium]|nr:hypothetical protein [Pirellulales bacterium]